MSAPGGAAAEFVAQGPAPGAERGLRAVFQRPWPVLGILFLIYMCHAMDRHVLAYLAEPIRKDLGLSDIQLGLLNGLAFAFFYTLLGVPVGYLADRVGRVLTISVACLVWTVCSMFGALSNSFAQLAAARVGVAMGESGGTAPSYALIADKFAPNERGRAYGIFHVGSSVGSFVGAAGSAWVAAHYGWRTALVVVAAPGLVFAAALLLLVREPERRGGVVAAADTPPIWRSFADFLRHPVLRLCFIFAGLTSCLAHSLIAWLPAYLMRVKGMTLMEVSAYYSLTFAISFGIGMWLGGFASDLIARRTPKAYAYVPAASLAIAIPFMIAAMATADWRISLALWVVPLCLAGTFLAPAVALIQAYAPARQATVFGSIYLLANNMIGAGLGPLYVGAVSDAFKPAHGTGALTYGLWALVPMVAIAVGGQLLIARAMGRHPAPGIEAAATQV